MSRVINHSWKNGGDESSNPVVVVLDNDHILITADADTDADGSPDADTIDGSGQRETALGKSNGWKGDNCDEFYCVNDCSGHGLCIGPNECKCNSGWEGKY